MAAIMPPHERVKEETIKWVWPRPITFTEFLELSGVGEDVELVDGSVVEKMSVQLEHEKLFGWLYRLLGDFVEQHELGIVLGSRTAVEIDQYRGRLPDLLFVSRDRSAMVQEKAIFGAPDLIIELISPNDRPSDIVALETDYCGIGVMEIVFIDQRKRRVRVLRRGEDDYQDETLVEGALVLETLGQLEIRLEWLFNEPRPVVSELLTQSVYREEQ